MYARLFVVPVGRAAVYVTCVLLLMGSYFGRLRLDTTLTLSIMGTSILESCIATTGRTGYSEPASDLITLNICHVHSLPQSTRLAIAQRCYYLSNAIADH